MIELKFRKVDFCRGRKTGEPREKPLKQGRARESKGENQQQMQSLGIEPGPQQ
jgi:hypothetical protein